MTLYEKAKAVLSFAYGGDHHIPPGLKDRGHLCEISVPAGIATFDGDVLTCLVIGAHQFCVRVEIAGGGPRKVKLYFHDRQREGRLFDRHPTMEQALWGYGLWSEAKGVTKTQESAPVSPSLSD